MKYLKIGTKPDTFYTEEASRSVISDVQPDLVIQVNNTKYLLHKAYSAAKFLRMTEAIAQGNLVKKIESFFDSCILQGWKDCITILQSVSRLPGWSDNPRIIRPCIDSVIEKILTHPSKVSWSFTYTRPGYSSKQHKSPPRDWWTEDVAELDLDNFRTIISSVRSTKQLPPALIGEALHVYACKHLPDPADEDNSSTAESVSYHRRVLELIVSMIPLESGSVSGSFLLRLLKVANIIGSQPSLKAELIRRSGCQLAEATATDLIIPSPSNPTSYDIGMVEAILESFLAQINLPLRRQDGEHTSRSMMRVANIFDAYLQIVASSPELPVSKFVRLAQSLPDVARQQHDELYQAIDTYLKAHAELSKAEKKQLCRVIDCNKLSPSVRTQAITNDELPLRIIVQLLFIEQERAAREGSRCGAPPDPTLCDESTSSVIHAGLRTQELAPPRQRRQEMERSLSLSVPKEAKKEREMAQGKGEGSAGKFKSKQKQLR